MTYLQFHLVFLLPPIALLTWMAAWRRGPLAGNLQPDDKRSWFFFALMPLLALLYTTPWDNFLVWKGVWSYPPDRVIGLIGYVPYEEYAFFVLQSLLGGLWVFWLLRRPQPVHAMTGRGRWWGAAFYLVLALVGVAMVFSERSLYMGLILAWAAPVLCLQWAFGGDLLLGMTPLRLKAVLTLTLYLWLADRLAIGLDIWQISERYTTGLHLFGLPVEEALFFLMTSLMVVEGLLLFIHPHSSTRVRGLLARG